MLNKLNQNNIYQIKAHHILVMIAFIILGCKVDVNENKALEQDDASYSGTAKSISARFTNLLQYEVDSLGFPRSMEPNGDVRGVPSKDWTSGFFPGNLLLIHQITGDQNYLNKAQEWLPYIEKEKYNDKTHDMGFKVFCSYGNALQATGNPAYAEIIVQAAQTLSTRFNSEIGCLKSWDFGGNRWTFPVIIDNMMNLELLFEATKLSGDSVYYQIADSHAATTLQNHFREDNSTYHVIDYSPETGEVVNKLTHQGLTTESSWARGQSWGLYGFTMAYRYTNKKAYLNKAIDIAKFLMDHPRMPEDFIPYWDLDDPKIPNAPRDASAGAVIASALLELSGFSPPNQESFKNRAQQIIETLSSSEYVLSGSNQSPFILKHSTGNMPKNDEIDLPIVYADYYFLEALLRTQNIQ